MPKKPKKYERMPLLIETKWDRDKLPHGFCQIPRIMKKYQVRRYEDKSKVDIVPGVTVSDVLVEFIDKKNEDDAKNDPDFKVK